MSESGVKSDKGGGTSFEWLARGRGEGEPALTFGLVDLARLKLKRNLQRLKLETDVKACCESVEQKRKEMVNL